MVLSALTAAPDTARAAGALDFVVREGTELRSGGQPFPAMGVNCYYLMVYGAESSLRAYVDEIFDAAQTLGATVLRTWAFNDGAGEWNALQTAPGTYTEKVLRGLDYAVKTAGEKRIRLLLPFVNNWDDYGGMSQYVAWSGSGGSHDDFYTDARVKAWYKDHVMKVLTRVNTFTGVAYRDDPAIFGWELANEPRAQEKGVATLNAWIGEMAAHVKAIDAKHLLSTGSEGFYGPNGSGKNPKSWMASNGVDFISNHSPGGIDFASYHAYPDLWSLTKNQTLNWIDVHLSDAKSILGKPVILGEIGKQQPIATRNEWFQAAYDTLLDNLAPGKSTAGALLWITYHAAYQDYDGFGIYVKSAAHASTVALVQAAADAVKNKLAGSPRFIRADANCDGKVDLTDAVRTLGILFMGQIAGADCCEEALDSNGDGAADVSDAVYTLIFAYGGGAAPPAPYPGCGEGQSCDVESGPCGGS